MLRPTFRCRWFSSGVSREPEFFPHSTVRRLVVGTGKQHGNENKKHTDQKPLPAEEPTPHGVKMNEINVQMLSRSLHRQIFARSGAAATTSGTVPPTNVEPVREELLRHGLDVSRPVVLPEVNVTLPHLRGANIEEHFWSIAEEQCEPYRRALETLPSETPAAPTKWSRTTGWTKYDARTGKPESVPFPDERALVFDVEVCVRAGQAPVMATAFGSSGSWYSWTSDRLAGADSRVSDGHGVGEDTVYQLSDMIPLESCPTHGKRKRSSREQRSQPRIVVGHNVSYDRARVREQYWLEPTALRFLDTMSLHVCVSGVTSYQRAMLKSGRQQSGPSSSVATADQMHELSEQASLNNLVDVYALYCDGAPLAGKSRRNTFVEGTLDDVSLDFDNLMSYCAEDVRATRAVLARLWPLFCERFPHPATLAGMLEMGSAYLPVNGNWEHYLTEADLAYEDLNLEAKHLLSQRADAACALLHDAAYRRDLWLWDQDWKVQQLKLKAPVAATKRKKATADQPDAGCQAPQANQADESEQCADEARLASKFAHLYELARRLPARRPLLPGYPAWYRQLCVRPPADGDGEGGWQPGPAARLGTGLQIAPSLLSLCWEGYPLHYIRGHGWGFLVPHRYERDPDADEPSEERAAPRVPLEQLVAACPVMELRQAGASRNESTEALQQLWRSVEATISRKEYYDRRRSRRNQQAADTPANHYAGSGVWCDVELDQCCYFVQLPHKDGAGHRVGNPLSKDFLAKFSENVLAGDGRAAERVVEIARMLSYWRNNRDRIRGQLVVWDPEAAAKGGAVDERIGAIVPQVVVCGTLTRRAMEPTWMTASNAQRERVGSELRAMVQAPPGYRIVGADVDSQELWIASLLGDADVAAEVTGGVSGGGGGGEANLHGVTPFGWMTLSGTKATRTDMHSVTAAAVGISRDHAKVINYARIYGAGVQFAERLLKQFNPTFSEAEARSKATKMFALTKGRRVYRMRADARQQQFPDAPPHASAYEALRLARACNRTVGELFHPPRWVGGTESAMFNRLEQIAGSAAPATPFLGGRLSRALEPAANGGSSGASPDDRFLPTRINWVVQSGAVDFLHLMLVCMRWLMGGDGRTRLRFCMSFHDEVRYLVPERYAHHAALAMHVTNLLTRSFCAHRVGFRDLPQSVAFFSTVELDRVLRKEAGHDCRTPSNPHGLHVGYGIPDGESLDIHQALARLGPKRSDMRRWEWHRPAPRPATGTRKPAAAAAKRKPLAAMELHDVGFSRGGTVALRRGVKPDQLSQEKSH